MKDINAQEYSELLNSDSPVVIDFHATWCGPCKVLSPILEELSSEVEGVEFVKLDVDQHPDIAGANGVMGVPTVVMFCLLYTSPSPRDKRQSRMPSSA